MLCTKFEQFQAPFAVKHYCQLSFYSKLMFAFFTAVNNFRGPVMQQKFTSTGSKGHVCDCDGSILFCFVCFCVSRFVDCDSNDIMIDGSEKCNCI